MLEIRKNHDKKLEDLKCVAACPIRFFGRSSNQGARRFSGFLNFPSVTGCKFAKLQGSSSSGSRLEFV